MGTEPNLGYPLTATLASFAHSMPNGRQNNSEAKAVSRRPGTFGAGATSDLPVHGRKMTGPVRACELAAPAFLRRSPALRRSHDLFVREAPRGAYTSSPSRAGGNRPTRRKPPRPDSTCISSNRSSPTSCSACWPAFYGGRNAPHGDDKRDRKLSKQRPAPDQPTGGIEWLRRF